MTPETEHMEALRLIYDMLVDGMLVDGQWFDFSIAPISKQRDELRSLYQATTEVLRCANRLEQHLDSLIKEEAA